MKISVIVPVYNVQDFLPTCIESVMQQTYQDFELVLVDDGATDTSGEICDGYADRYPQQVKVVHVVNGGVFQARLTGIKEAIGEVLIFLDADDCLRKDALECISACFHKSNCDMVLYNASECEAFPSIVVGHSLGEERVFLGDAKKQLYKNIIEGKVPNSVWSKAVRAQCAKIPEHLSRCTVKYGEDLLLSVCLMTQCRKIVHLEEGLYHYRKRPGSAVHSVNVRVINDSVKIVHTELEKYIDQWAIPELKPLHSARKVKSWVYNLAILQNSQKQISQYEYKEMVQSMAKDPYFCCAYKSMAESLLSYYERCIAWCLYHKQYYALTLLYRLKKMIQKSR